MLQAAVPKTIVFVRLCVRVCSNQCSPCTLSSTPLSLGRGFHWKPRAWDLYQATLKHTVVHGQEHLHNERRLKSALSTLTRMRLPDSQPSGELRSLISLHRLLLSLLHLGPADVLSPLCGSIFKSRGMPTVQRLRIIIDRRIGHSSAVKLNASCGIQRSFIMRRPLVTFPVALCCIMDASKDQPELRQPKAR